MTEESAKKADTIVTSPKSKPPSNLPEFDASDPAQRFQLLDVFEKDGKIKATIRDRLTTRTNLYAEGDEIGQYKVRIIMLKAKIVKMVDESDKVYTLRNPKLQ